MNELALLLAATLASGTPLAIAGLGLLLNEKAGILNLGAEGIMLVAAIAGFAAAATSSPSPPVRRPVVCWPGCSACSSSGSTPTNMPAAWR
jgi:ABC-type uncharacterized transport system permease subunit